MAPFAPYTFQAFPSSPVTRVRRMAEGYIGGEAGYEPEYQVMRRAVLTATLCLPPFARANARKNLIGVLESEFQQHGIDPPQWMARLREDIGW